MQIIPLPAMPEIIPGDDLALRIAEALDAAHVARQAGDILVVTQKIVSKAEGRFIALDDVEPSPQATDLAATVRKDARVVELVLRESAAIVRAVPHVLITRHRTGHVMANAGIDRSNLGARDEEAALLLPEDADASAERLQEALSRRGIDMAVLITDSFGRPWRHGVVNVAIGASGLPSLIDRRGSRDRDGRALEVTQIAVADMLASAAGLVMGEGAEGVPVAIVRGLHWDAPLCPAAALVRPPEEDLFR
jgi:coenzyme F420-0:L-glutamate ligase/coenzyme F420-1:gamma-L-glutamate ligase